MGPPKQKDFLLDEDVVYENMPRRTRPYRGRKEVSDYLRQFDGVDPEDVDDYEVEEFTELTSE